MLTDEAALHLLPPLDKAPGGADAYLGKRADIAAAPLGQDIPSAEQEQGVLWKPPKKVLQMYAQLESQAAFEQAVRARSMVPDLFASYKRQGWL